MCQYPWYALDICTANTWCGWYLYKYMIDEANVSPILDLNILQ